MHKQQLHQPLFCMAKVNLMSQAKHLQSQHLKSNVLQILKSFVCQQDLTDEKLHYYLHVTDGAWLFLEKHTQTPSHIRQDTNNPKKQFHASLTQSANRFGLPTGEGMMGSCLAQHRFMTPNRKIIWLPFTVNTTSVYPSYHLHKPYAAVTGLHDHDARQIVKDLMILTNPSSRHKC